MPVVYVGLIASYYTCNRTTESDLTIRCRPATLVNIGAASRVESARPLYSVDAGFALLIPNADGNLTRPLDSALTALGVVYIIHARMCPAT